MDKAQAQSSKGIGFVGALTILFIGLKLTGCISWSWLWVFSPIWISFSLGIGFIILFSIGFIIYRLVTYSDKS